MIWLKFLSAQEPNETFKWRLSLRNKMLETFTECLPCREVIERCSLSHKGSCNDLIGSKCWRGTQAITGSSAHKAVTNFSNWQNEELDSKQKNLLKVDKLYQIFNQQITNNRRPGMAWTWEYECRFVRSDKWINMTPTTAVIDVVHIKNTSLYFSSFVGSSSKMKL
jgi:hypothetical protein